MVPKTNDTKVSDKETKIADLAVTGFVRRAISSQTKCNIQLQIMTNEITKKQPNENSPMPTVVAIDADVLPFGNSITKTTTITVEAIRQYQIKGFRNPIKAKIPIYIDTSVTK